MQRARLDREREVTDAGFRPHAPERDLDAAPWFEDTKSDALDVAPLESGPCPKGEGSYPEVEELERPRTGSIVGHRYRVIASLGRRHG